MTDQTLIVYAWPNTNPFDHMHFPLHDWTPDLAERFARIITGDNHILRSQVVRAWWEGDTPHETRTDIAFDGTATVRTGNYIKTKNGIQIDPDNPYTEDH